MDILGQIPSNNPLSRLPDGLAALIAAAEMMESQDEMADSFDIKNHTILPQSPSQSKVKIVDLKRLPTVKSYGTCP